MSRPAHLPSTATSPDVPPEAPRGVSPAARLLRVGLVGLLTVGLLAGGRQFANQLPAFTAYVDGLGAIGPIVFIAGYALATIAFIPGSVLTFAAGAIFGLGKGVAVVFVGATIGSTLAFLISRYVARDAVQRRVADNVKFAAVDRAIAAQGRRIVLLLRLSPAFPFSLLNYALGLTRISLTDYVVASIGMLPGTVLFVYSGKLAGDVAAVAGGATAPKGAAYYSVLAIGLLATVVVTTIITRTARVALRSATEGTADTSESAV